MKIHKHLRIILLSTCLSPFLAMGAMAIDTQPKNINAANSTVSKHDLSAQKELFQMQLDAKNELIQLQLDAKKELLQKDIEAQAKRIDAFEKRMDDQTSRISDIGSGVDKFGIIVSIFGTLITVLFVVAGFLGYRTAKNDAKETAREAASQWFNDNHIALTSQIKRLEERAVLASEKIDGHEERVAQKSSAAHAAMEAFEEAVEAQKHIMQNQMSQDRTEEKSENPPSKNNSAIEQKAEQLKQLPESEYTFTDWNTRAFAAYREGKLEDAIFYWDKAIGSSDIQLHASAQIMFNKGVTLDKLNRREEAIEAYDVIITKFGTAKELNLREPVAKAMINKGFRLDQLNRGEEAIATYDAIITQFGTAEELTLREVVANAMVNRGSTLDRLNRDEEAIAAYDAMIAQFSTAEELTLSEPVANAMINKGFSLLCKAKANWENVALAKELLVNANNTCNLAILKKPIDGMAHGNLAYITWLQGDAVAAEQHFKNGLAAAAHGGEILYKATLTDFDIHPIAPDQGFKELVDKLWAEYQQSHIS